MSKTVIADERLAEALAIERWKGKDAQVYVAGRIGTLTLDGEVAAGCLCGGIATVAQNRNIQLRSVNATLEADMDLQGILGIDEFVFSGYPHLEEAYRFGEGVLPELARRGALARR